MDEKNKNEKTFSDLFSNINTNTDLDTSSDVNNNFISFNSINEKTTEQKNKDITLENLFNKTIENNIVESKNSDNKTITKNSVSFSDLNIFDKEKNTYKRNNKSNIENLKEEKNTSNIFEQTPIDNKDTPIFEKNTSNIFEQVSNKKQNDNISIEKVSDKDNNIQQSPKSSPIFEKKQSTQDSIAQPSSTNIQSISSMDFSDNTSNNQNVIEDNSEDTVSTSIPVSESKNIFFDSPFQKIENTIESPSEKKLENQSENNSETKFPPPSEVKKINLSSEETVEPEKNNFDINPFFTEVSSKPVSTSPFFEELPQEEQINPFFENKLNLVENKKYDNNSNVIDTSNIKHFNVKIVKKKEPLIKIILGVLSYAIFIWLLLIGITLLGYVIDIKIRAAKGDTSPPKYNAYVVLTGSMLPEIQVYDVVITKRVEPKDLNEGDVITFASSDTRFLNTIITHRIIKKNPPNTKTKEYTFQTKGDNNNVADSALVQSNNIYGKVILKIPKLGYLQEFLATDGGWILVILLPSLAVISYDIVKLIAGLKRKKYKNIKVQK